MSDSQTISKFKFSEKLLRPKDRIPEIQGDVRLPVGTVIVSADNHFSVSEDIFYEGFPEHLKSRAPRIWREGDINHIGFDGKTLLPDILQVVAVENEEVPGIYDFDARVKDLQGEGVQKEIAFPQMVLLLLFYPDYEVRDWAFRVYNKHLADLNRRAPGFFYGVGLINHWEPNKARETLREFKETGLKTFMLPLNAGKFPDGSDILYASEEMDPFWEAIADAGVPVCFHIGEGVSRKGRGAAGSLHLQNHMPFRKIVGDLIFGGVLDRHPSLRIVFAEGGINWMAAMLQDIDVINAAHQRSLDWKLEYEPEHYFRTNFYATFMDDELGLALIDRIGIDRAMWSTDYPHNEGIFGKGWTVIQDVITAAGQDGARKILGGNAIEVFNLD